VIIAISGKSGSGKNSVGEQVAKALGLRVVSFSFKDAAAKLGKGLMDYQKDAAKDKSIDLDLDQKIAQEAAKGDCVVVTWLGPWVVKQADLRVWLDAPAEIRAVRIGARDKMGVEDALAHITARDADNRSRYKKLYGIDIDDRSIFDMALDSSRLTIDQMASMVADAARKKQAGQKNRKRQAK